MTRSFFAILFGVTGALSLVGCGSSGDIADPQLESASQTVEAEPGAGVEGIEEPSSGIGQALVKGKGEPSGTDDSPATEEPKSDPAGDGKVELADGGPDTDSPPVSTTGSSPPQFGPQLPSGDSRGSDVPQNAESIARLKKLQQMIDDGMNVNEADPSGRTALMMAAFDGHTDVVRLLLKHGAQVDQLDEVGRTALMYAASGPFPKTVGVLLESGAEVNRVDQQEGWTALMLAAAEGHQPVVERLLAAGADRTIKDLDGDKAVDHARQRNQTRILELLK